MTLRRLGNSTYIAPQRSLPRSWRSAASHAKGGVPCTAEPLDPEQAPAVRAIGVDIPVAEIYEGLSLDLEPGMAE